MVSTINSLSFRSRSLIIDAISRGFSYPVADFYADLASGDFISHIRQEFEITDDDSHLHRVLDDLDAGAQKVAADRSRENLESEYIELFEHSQTISPVHLFGGLYLTSEGGRLETLQRLISLYRDCGLEMEDGSEHADHLIVVLEFLALLYRKHADLEDEGDSQGIQQLEMDISLITKELEWTKELEAELSKRNSHPFYLPLSQLLKDMLSMPVV